ncbi:MAG: DUF72 domain-containing protein [Phreatobacter sp.]|uniref:DUF72 domain-containing protein n=1 Tax=Phreatobacter sp. TaxID=1966341 RepID=UPI001A4528DD|nr:DUF72 domain-containing protein [Phreatobacter sp.]MBL8571587.1 DUF72 domain-containing protein [Phreatobacter sp.]
MAKRGEIRVGIGGWTFEPWRGVFYPEKLAQKGELAYAGSKLTAIEINGTFYGSQKPESFRKWRGETPDSFVFSMKGPRFATNRRVLAEAGDSVKRFLESGITELGPKLGPINWQLAATKKFDPEDIAAFLQLLPPKQDGHALRHVIEVRHASFMVPEFIALLRERGVAAVFADEPDYPYFFDPTASFVYLRLQCASESEPLGYAPDVLDDWAARAKAWAGGQMPDGLPLVGTPPQAEPRDVFLFMINGHKPKAPAAAMALIERLK